GGDAAENARAEMALLKALASLYVDCHRAEKARLLSLSESERSQIAQAGGGALPMDRLWADFELRASMMEALAESALPGGDADSAPAPREAVLPPPVRATPPAAPPEPPAPAQREAQEQGGAYNPMAFF